MEQGLSLKIRNNFDLKEQDLKTYSPLTLAYIGDSIYALVAKSVIVETSNCPASKLHKETIKYVSAGAQARIYRYFLDIDILTDEEADIMRRGRNAKSHSPAKNASITDYRMATGVEALVGWLYLKEEEDRLLLLLKSGFEYLNGDK